MLPIMTKLFLYVLTIMLYWLVSAIPSACSRSQESPRAVAKEILENIRTNPAIANKDEIILNALLCSFNK